MRRCQRRYLFSFLWAYSRFESLRMSSFLSVFMEEWLWVVRQGGYKPTKGSHRTYSDCLPLAPTDNSLPNLAVGQLQGPHPPANSKEWPTECHTETIQIKTPPKDNRQAKENLQLMSPLVYTWCWPWATHPNGRTMSIIGREGSRFWESTVRIKELPLLTTV